MKLADARDELIEEFADHGVDLDADAVSERLEHLTEEYSVPMDEAMHSVRSHYADEHDVDIGRGGSSSDTVTPIAEIDAPDQWLTIEGEYVEDWDADADAIAQVGLIGDATGTIKLVAWDKSDLPRLEEGQAYRIESAITDAYQGRFSVQCNSSTSIEAIDADIEVGESATDLEAALVDVQEGSGLIERCTADDCTRVLDNGRCAEHGDVEGDFDLRIKAVFDDGETVQPAILDADATEALTGLDLETAQELAQEALDKGVVADRIIEQVVGRYYRVSGPRMGRYLLVDTINEMGAPAPDAIDEQLVRGRSQ